MPANAARLGAKAIARLTEIGKAARSSLKSAARA